MLAASIEKNSKKITLSFKKAKLKQNFLFYLWNEPYLSIYLFIDRQIDR